MNPKERKFSQILGGRLKPGNQKTITNRAISLLMFVSQSGIHCSCLCQWALWLLLTYGWDSQLPHNRIPSIPVSLLPRVKWPAGTEKSFKFPKSVQKTCNEPAWVHCVTLAPSVIPGETGSDNTGKKRVNHPVGKVILRDNARGRRREQWARQVFQLHKGITIIPLSRQGTETQGLNHLFNISVLMNIRATT